MLQWERDFQVKGWDKRDEKQQPIKALAVSCSCGFVRLFGEKDDVLAEHTRRMHAVHEAHRPRNIS